MISLSMIVKNEEKYLRDCLESVKGIVDEIILTDTGSADNTIKIAEEYGAKIFHFDWINDFSAARNFSLSHCTGDYILYLDADERLSSKSVERLKKLTAAKDKKAFYCQVCSVDEVNSRPSVMSYVRLFPNDKAHRFEGAVHEQIEFALRQNKVKIENSDIEIIHVGYNLGKEGLFQKAKRNLEILLKEYNKNGSSYNAFQLAQTYGILEEKQQAVKYFNIAVQDKNLKPEYKSTAYRYISIDFTDKQDWNSALAMIQESIKCDSNQPLALLVASKIHLKLGSAKESEFYCLKAYETNSKYLKNRSSSSQVILLSQNDILSHCLNIAVMLKNINLFNFFFKEYEKSGSSNSSSNIELKYYELLLNNKTIQANDLTELIFSVNESNLGLYGAILDNYQYPDIKINILKGISEKFPQNSVNLNRLGLALAANNENEESAKVLENSLKINPADPSTVFYLISAYLKLNRLNEITMLLNQSKIKYSNIPAVIEKLNILEQRLKLR